MIGLMCLKEMIITKPPVRASVLFVISGTAEMNFRFQPKVCDGCRDLMQKWF